MKITLIQPPSLQSQDGYSTMTLPPLGLAYLAASAKEAGHDVRLIDAIGEAPDSFRPWHGARNFMVHGLSPAEVAARIPRDADVVGLSCMFTHAWPMVREVARLAREAAPRAILVAGGEHCSALPELVLRQAPIDLVVYGEGEETFVDVLARLERGERRWSGVPGVAFLDENGAFALGPRRDRLRDPDDLPLPDWSLVPLTDYMNHRLFAGPSARGARSIPLLATRGCPYACTFCSSPGMWTRVYRVRDPAKVVDEMQRWQAEYGANDFQFQDLTAIVRKNWIVSFCREVLSRGMRISWQLPVGTRSEAIDREVADLLFASGCRHISYAPESGSKRILEAVDKKVDLERMAGSIQATLAAGLRVSLFLIIGFPQETVEDVRRTLRFVRRMARLGVDEVSVSNFVPLPGTALFQELNAASPIALDDDYCYAMVGAPALLRVRSWNPRFSAARLALIKLWAYLQFFVLSYATHPRHAWRMLRAMFDGNQTTKTDRVLAELRRSLWRRVWATAG